MTTTRRAVTGLSLLLATSAARAADVDYAKAVAEVQKQGNAAEVNRLCSEWAARAPGDRALSQTFSSRRGSGPRVNRARRSKGTR